MSRETFKWQGVLSGVSPIVPISYHHVLLMNLISVQGGTARGQTKRAAVARRLTGNRQSLRPVSVIYGEER